MVFENQFKLHQCSDDEISMNKNREEGLECPICWESFNVVENVPYILWCGHTLCKNCVLGLQWAVVKLPTLPIQLPFFVSCPWCSLLSFRLVYKGSLKFPCKNFFLLWMVDSMNGDSVKSHSSVCGDLQQVWSSNKSVVVNQVSQAKYTCALVFFVHLIAKFPLVFVFLLIVCNTCQHSHLGPLFLSLFCLLSHLYMFCTLHILVSIGWLGKSSLELKFVPHCKSQTFSKALLPLGSIKLQSVNFIFFQTWGKNCQTLLPLESLSFGQTYLPMHVNISASGCFFIDGPPDLFKRWRILYLDPSIDR